MALPRSAAIAAALLAVAPSVFGAERRGRVAWQGQPPAASVLNLEDMASRDTLEGCGATRRVSQRLLIGPDGGIANVVVWIDTGQAAPASDGHVPQTVRIEQEGCAFIPHVVVMRPGQTLAVGNSDPITHDVRIFQDRTMVINTFQDAKAPPVVRRFDAPGRYLIRCGLHQWMYAWAVVAEGGTYAVTGSDGRFTMNLPPGRHRLRLWHETLGERTRDIDVAASGQGELVVWLKGEGE